MEILDWRDYNQRIRVVNNILGLKVLKNILKAKFEYCYCDDISWLSDYFDINLFKKRFLDEFKAIKCFHACSPINMKSYEKKGFIGGNHEENIVLFNTIFSDVSLPYREKAIKKRLDTKKDEISKTFFLCESKLLVNKDGNYLIYGSEYLSGLAENLNAQHFSNEDFKQRLKGIGVPTIIEADLDFGLLDHYQIDSLISSSLSDWGNYYLFRNDFEPSEVSIIAKEKLPSSVIVNHWHPEKIYDPYNYGNLYISKKITCCLCS